MSELKLTFDNICVDCGVTANNMVCIHRYGQMAHKPSFDVSTMHKGICDVCGKEKAVTEPRDYFYPTRRAFTYLRNYLQRGVEA